jgi:hypothetical protein
MKSCIAGVTLFALGALSSTTLSSIAQASAQGTQATAFGLTHTSLGGANLSVHPQTGALNVGGIGSSGNDGVRINTAELEGFDAHFEPLVLAPGSHLLMGVEGLDATGTSMGLVSSIEIRDVGSPNGYYDVTWDIAGVSTYTVRAYLAGEMVFEELGVSPLVDALPYQMSPAKIQSMHTLWYCDVNGNWSSHKEAFDVVPGGHLALLAGQPVDCDLIEITPEQIGTTVPTLADLRFTGAGVSNLTFVREGVRIDGVQNRALGSAKIVPTGNGRVAVDTSNGPSWMEDAWEWTFCETAYLVEPASGPARAEQTGVELVTDLGVAPLRLDARGAFGGAPEQSLYTLTLQSSGSRVQLLPDFSALGATGMTVECYSPSGASIGSQSGSTAMAIYVDGLPVHMSWWLLMHMFDIESIEFLGMVATVTVDGASHADVGRIAIRPHVAVESEGLTRVVIATGGPSLFEILRESYVPLPSAPTTVTVYCTAKLNSLGCTPTISASGSPSASAGAGFTLSGANVRNNTAGILIYGVNGAAAVPFQGGFLCVQPPIKRSIAVHSGGSPVGSDCSGLYSIDMSAFAAGALGGNPLPDLQVAGTRVNCQFWGRDPGYPAPSNSSLTDAAEYTVLP